MRQGKPLLTPPTGISPSIAGVGTMEYTHSNRPYQVSLVTPTGDAVPAREQSLTYTSFQRPATLEEDGYNATMLQTTVLNLRYSLAVAIRAMNTCRGSG